MMVRQAHHIPLVSVIVPVHQEDRHLVKNLTQLQGDPRIEVIVVEAEKVGVANRAYQMNLGACQARGQLLVFLHVDTLIHPKDLWITYQRLKEDPSFVGGVFRFTLDTQSPKARLLELGVLLRQQIFHLPYGDQAIFIRRSRFEAMGGYPEVPLLEDVLFIQKMKKQGKLFFCSKPAITSVRRWERHGYLKTTVVNLATMILWKSGVSLERLHTFRRRFFS
ncbi:MAG: glycosyltransferase [Deltaproteobacteria bacterium]|nr:glycosyltransferase [Deltaproteobacteria bacterium]